MKGTLRESREKKIPDLPPLSDLSPPEELNQRASEIWNDIAPTLSGKSLLTHADRKMLTIYCIELAKYFQYTEDIGTEVVLELRNGQGAVINYMKNPLCDLADKSLKAAVTIGIHFGLTPASRGKMNLAPEGKSKEQAAADQLGMLRGVGAIMKAS